MCPPRHLPYMALWQTGDLDHACTVLSIEKWQSLKLYKYNLYPLFRPLESIAELTVSGELSCSLTMPEQKAASSFSGSKRSKGTKDTQSSTASFMQVVSEIADQPTSKDQLDVKIFFKASGNMLSLLFKDQKSEVLLS